MAIDLTISNYRCFHEKHPATLRIEPGFTAIVGKNHSGKSALLRVFYELRSLFQSAANPNYVATQFSPAGHGLNRPQEVRDPREILTNSCEADLRMRISLPGGTLAGRNGLARMDALEFKIRRTDLSVHPTMLASAHDGPPMAVARSWNATDGILAAHDGSHLRFDLEAFVNAVQPLGSTVYFPAYRNAVNAGGAGGPYFDMTIGQAFVVLWNRLKTGTDNKLQNRAALRLETQIRRLLGFESFQINAADDDTTLQFMIDDHPYRSDEVGSGVAQFVLVLANAAGKQPAYILIDEPELNLHPSLQVDFLTTLASYATHGVIFATHSLGLARAVAQRIYSVARNQDGTSEVRPYEGTSHLPELLGALSYSSYAELGFKKVLLVEGVNEVLLAHQWLRLYQRDHQVVVLPLGGGALINGERDAELRELLRIAPKPNDPQLFALVDSDRAKADGVAKRSVSEFAAVCQRIGIHCHVTKRPAIENYLHARAVEAAFPGRGFKAPGEFEKGFEPPWSKPANWRVAREMTLAEIDGTDIGDLFRRL